MAAEIKRDPDLEWLDHVQPVGLVVAPVLLKELGLPPTRQTQVDSAQVAEHIEAVTHSAKSSHANPAPLQFWSQPSHMHIDRFRFPDKTRAPGARQDPVSTHNLALVLNQNSEQVEFARRHLDVAAGDISTPSADIQP